MASEFNSDQNMYNLLIQISSQNAATLSKLESIDGRLERVYNDHKELESRVAELEAAHNKRAGAYGMVATISSVVTVVIGFFIQYIKGGNS